ncbi:MAG: hypothetical protein ACYTEX_28415 [Planctomycetota bacterium]|jgi:hypothetical protein
MKWTDIIPDTVVYHSLYTHWGKGVVQRIVHVDPLTALFEKGTTRRALVQFEAQKEPVQVLAAMLRKTPNRRKIREMVAMYARRGVAAQDDGDRLILPNSAAREG